MDVRFPGSGAVRRAQELSSQSESSGQVSGFIKCKLLSKSLSCKSGNASGWMEFSGQRARSKDGSLKVVVKFGSEIELDVEGGFEVPVSPRCGNA